MAEVRDDDGGGFLLEHHCPICAAARSAPASAARNWRCSAAGAAARTSRSSALSHILAGDRPVRG